MIDYIYLVIPFTSVAVAQIIKFTIESVQEKKLKWLRLLNGNGGMPSTHTSFCFSLTAYIGMMYGINNPLFAMGLVFSLIVSYDAMGMRRESEKQAVAINKIVDELDDDIPKIKMKKLKEQIGHEPLEVFMGMILGTFMALVFYYLVFPK
ncbi:MAG: divergent PAP2 family protein [Ignavibacteriales bacterium]